MGSESFTIFPSESDVFHLFSHELDPTEMEHSSTASFRYVLQEWQKQRCKTGLLPFSSGGEAENRRELLSEKKSSESILSVATVLAFSGSLSQMVPATAPYVQRLKGAAEGSSREIARALVTIPGALEIILMLADVGPALAKDLGEDAAGAENLLEAIAELRRVDLITVKGQTVSLTDAGASVVRSLRNSL